MSEMMLREQQDAGGFGAARDDVLSPRDRAEWRICTREVTTTEKPRLQQTCFRHPVTV